MAKVLATPVALCQAVLTWVDEMRGGRGSREWVGGKESDGEEERGDEEGDQPAAAEILPQMLS